MDSWGRGFTVGVEEGTKLGLRCGFEDGFAEGLARCEDNIRDLIKLTRKYPSPGTPVSALNACLYGLHRLMGGIK